MKITRLFFSILFVVICFAANAQNYYLMPEKFFLQKGGTLKVHLMTTNEDFTKQTDVKYNPEKTSDFFIYQGKKKDDLRKMAVSTDSIAPFFTYEAADDGLLLLSMSTTPPPSEMTRSKFLRTLDAGDPDNLADKIKSSNLLFYKEKFNDCMKTLVEVEKNKGKAFDKPLGQDYEIILKEDPYKFNYGDDITALILFKGKPMVNAAVTLIVKTVGGNVFPQKLSADASGLIYFKLSREGIYALSTNHTEQLKDNKTADFECWRASFTFAFSSNDELPNTYKEFGFGNVH